MNDVELSPQNQMNATGQAAAMAQIAMVKEQIRMAKEFPRNFTEVHTKIMKACSRKLLAEAAMWKYPRGGKNLSGPSIRMAEVLAQNYGNMDFGIRELSQGNGMSVVESYCMDLETNVRSTKTFQVPHSVMKQNNVKKVLTDQRDIYEHVANYGARRLRACILAIIPSDIVEEASAKCKQTVIGKSDTPIEDRIRAMVTFFDTKFQITSDMIEQYIGHELKTLNEEELYDLKLVGTSLKDGQSKRSDWFKFKEEKETESVTEMTDVINEKSGAIDIKSSPSEQPENVDNSVEISNSEKTTTDEKKPAPAKKSAAKKKSSSKKATPKKEPVSPMMQKFEDEVEKTKSTK